MYLLLESCENLLLIFCLLGSERLYLINWFVVWVCNLFFFRILWFVIIKLVLWNRFCFLKIFSLYWSLWNCFLFIVCCLVILFWIDLWYLILEWSCLICFYCSVKILYKIGFKVLCIMKIIFEIDSVLLSFNL